MPELEWKHSGCENWIQTVQKLHVSCNMQTTFFIHGPAQCINSYSITAITQKKMHFINYRVYTVDNMLLNVNLPECTASGRPPLTVLWDSKQSHGHIFNTNTTYYGQTVPIKPLQDM